MTGVIRYAGLTKRYRGVTALDGLDLNAAHPAGAGHAQRRSGVAERAADPGPGRPGPDRRDDRGTGFLSLADRPAQPGGAGAVWGAPARSRGRDCRGAGPG